MSTKRRATKERRRAVRDRQRQRKSRFIEFFLPDGRKCEVDLKINPLAKVYRQGALTAPQFAAAARFERDYDQAEYYGMRCRGFEPGVDGGQMAQANLVAIDAQRRLHRLNEYLGEEDFLLMESLVGLKTGLRSIEKEGGDHVRIIGDKFRKALDKTAVFYDLISKEPPSNTLKALRTLLQRMVAEVGEHVH